MWSSVVAVGSSLLAPFLQPRSTQDLPNQQIERDNTSLYIGVAAAIIFLVVIVLIIRKK